MSFPRLPATTLFLRRLLLASLLLIAKIFPLNYQPQPQSLYPYVGQSAWLRLTGLDRSHPQDSDTHWTFDQNNIDDVLPIQQLPSLSTSPDRHNNCTSWPTEKDTSLSAKASEYCSFDIDQTADISELDASPSAQECCNNPFPNRHQAKLVVPQPRHTPDQGAFLNPDSQAVCSSSFSAPGEGSQALDSVNLLRPLIADQEYDSLPDLVSLEDIDAWLAEAKYWLLPEVTRVPISMPTCASMNAPVPTESAGGFSYNSAVTTTRKVADSPFGHILNDTLAFEESIGPQIS